MRFIEESSYRNQFAFIDLFSGAGLFSSAFVNTGFNPIQAVELCSIASATYAKNLGNHIINGSVVDVRPVGLCDVLVGGPPCQGFSTLGKRNLADPRNRLSMEMVRWASLTSPKVVVVENVAVFLESPHWEKMRRGFKKLGYGVQSVVLNAADFGVPQIRNRSFTFASKVGFPVIEPSHAGKHRSVRDAFSDLAAPVSSDRMHRIRALSEQAYDRICNIPYGGDKRDLMRNSPHLVPRSWWAIPNQATDVWGRMALDEPANTIRTGFINPSKGRYLHPTENRVITMREAARLHSIPDNWEFEGTDTSVARQIGNSVPPQLGMAVAEAVMKILA